MYRVGQKSDRPIPLVHYITLYERYHFFGPLCRSFNYRLITCESQIPNTNHEIVFIKDNDIDRYDISFVCFVPSFTQYTHFTLFNGLLFSNLVPFTKHHTGIKSPTAPQHLYLDPHGPMMAHWEWSHWSFIKCFGIRNIRIARLESKQRWML